MRNKTVTTAQLERLNGLIDLIYDQAVDVLPQQVERWETLHATLKELVRDSWRQSARPHAGRDMAHAAQLLASSLLSVLEDRAPPQRPRQLPPREPETTEITVEGESIDVDSAAQQEMLRLMGEEGLSRSWRIYARIVNAGLVKNAHTASNILRKLRKRGLVTEYRTEDGAKPTRWNYAPGGGRILPVLTSAGRTWFRAAYGMEPVEAEIFAVVRQHQSPQHGVAILEACDYLQDAGYSVNTAPDAILAEAAERWGKRVEPDLVIYINGKPWPVEVQREISKRTLEKYNKAIALGGGRMALIVFNERSRQKQEAILREAIQRKQLRRGTVLLASLEAMDKEVDWDWDVIDTSIHW
jgi:hypothetical protein